MESSMYTKAALNPALTAVAFAGAALAFLAASRAIRQAREASAREHRIADRAVAIPIDVEPLPVGDTATPPHGDVMPRGLLTEGIEPGRDGLELDEGASEGATPPHGDVLPRGEQAAPTSGRADGDPSAIGPSR